MFTKSRASSLCLLVIATKYYLWRWKQWHWKLYFNRRSVNVRKSFELEGEAQCISDTSCWQKLFACIISHFLRTTCLTFVARTTSVWSGLLVHCQCIIHRPFLFHHTSDHGPLTRGPARLCYAARGHICKLCMCCKNYTATWAVGCTTPCYLFTFDQRNGPK